MFCEIAGRTGVRGEFEIEIYGPFPYALACANFASCGALPISHITDACLYYGGALLPANVQEQYDTLSSAPSRSAISSQWGDLAKMVLQMGCAWVTPHLCVW